MVPARGKLEVERTHLAKIGPASTTAVSVYQARLRNESELVEHSARGWIIDEIPGEQPR